MFIFLILLIVSDYNIFIHSFFVISIYLYRPLLASDPSIKGLRAKKNAKPSTLNPEP